MSTEQNKAVARQFTNEAVVDGSPNSSAYACPSALMTRSRVGRSRRQEAVAIGCGSITSIPLTMIDGEGKSPSLSSTSTFVKPSSLRQPRRSSRACSTCGQSGTWSSSTLGELVNSALQQHS